MTSRQPIIDQVEMIGQMLALTSHYQEIVNSYGSNDTVSEEDYKFCKEQIIILTKSRRTLMELILEQYKNSDKLYWCITKHMIFARELSNELLQSDFNNEIYISLQNESTLMLYGVLSRFLGLEEITTCGRCFNDMIEKEKNK